MGHIKEYEKDGYKICEREYVIEADGEYELVDTHVRSISVTHPTNGVRVLQTRMNNSCYESGIGVGTSYFMNGHETLHAIGEKERTVEELIREVNEFPSWFNELLEKGRQE